MANEFNDTLNIFYERRSSLESGDCTSLSRIQNPLGVNIDRQIDFGGGTSKRALLFFFIRNY